MGVFQLQSNEAGERPYKKVTKRRPYYDTSIDLIKYTRPPRRITDLSITIDNEGSLKTVQNLLGTMCCIGIKTKGPTIAKDNGFVPSKVNDTVHLVDVDGTGECRIEYKFQVSKGSLNIKIFYRSLQIHSLGCKRKLIESLKKYNVNEENSKISTISQSLKSQPDEKDNEEQVLDRPIILGDTFVFEDCVFEVVSHTGTSIEARVHEVEEPNPPPSYTHGIVYTFNQQIYFDYNNI